ncbi:MAG: enolase C-terminal domain-like protein [Streptosporangiaceae bacterium]
MSRGDDSSENVLTEGRWRDRAGGRGLRGGGLDGEGLDWFEEPLRHDDYDGHARLARDVRTPVMLGENFYGPRDMLAAVRAPVRRTAAA